MTSSTKTIKAKINLSNKETNMTAATKAAPKLTKKAQKELALRRHQAALKAWETIRAKKAALGLAS